MKKKFFAMILVIALSVSCFCVVTSAATLTKHYFDTTASLSCRGWENWINVLNVIPDNDTEHQGLRASGTPYAILKNALLAAYGEIGALPDSTMTNNYDTYTTSTGATIPDYADQVYGAKMYCMEGGKQLAYDLWNEAIDPSLAIVPNKSIYVKYVKATNQSIYNAEDYQEALDALFDYIDHCHYNYQFNSTSTSRYDEQNARFNVFKAKIAKLSPSDGTYDIENYIDGDGNKVAPAYTGCYFGGWYADADCTTVYKQTTGKVYAKFVNNKVLAIKMQTSANLTSSSAYSDLRLITTVDDLGYKEVGFIITFNDGEEQKISTQTVYNSISYTSGTATAKYTPAAFCTNSKYFATYVIRNIPNEKFAGIFSVTPYWVTPDGTTVKGTNTTTGISDAKQYIKVGIEDNTQRVYQDVAFDYANSERALSVTMAKNESEGAQFILTNSAKAFNVKNVTVSNLTDGSGNSIPSSDIKVYRQHYIWTDCHRANEVNNYIDAWYPDALIEMKYDIAHYSSGLPVVAQKNQGYWLTIKTRTTTAAGTYTGKVTVTTSAETVTVPVTVKVYDFALDTTQHFNTALCMSSLNDYDGQREQYYDFLKEYRLNGFYLPLQEEGEPGTNNPTGLTLSDYTAALTHVTSDTTPSAFFNLNYRRHWEGEGDSKKYVFNDDFKAILNEVAKTMSGRMYAYTADEPAWQYGEGWAEEVAWFTNVVKEELPMIKTLVTFDDYLPTASSSDGQLMRYVPDVWAIKPDRLVDGDVEDLHAHGQEIWFYTCNWPTNGEGGIATHLDSSLVGMRVLGWLEYGLDIDGYTHYSITNHDRGTDSTHTETSQWLNPNSYAENGTLKNSPPGDNYIIIIGLEGDGVVDENVPVPTIRLEAMRDSMEDYEYLRLFEEKIKSLNNTLGTSVDADTAMAYILNAMYKSTKDWTDNTDILNTARNELANRIAENVNFIYYMTGTGATRTIHVYGANTSTVKIAGKTVYVSGGHAQLTVSASTTSVTPYTLVVNGKTVTMNAYN